LQFRIEIRSFALYPYETKENRKNTLDDNKRYGYFINGALGGGRGVYIKSRI
jgi:hypothetical protein